jgi:hypothetical protein
LIYQVFKDLVPIGSIFFAEEGVKTKDVFFTFHIDAKDYLACGFLHF